jgi:carbon storage regulator
MLVMTRKIGETIVIGDQIEVTLVQIQLSQNQVRLGINAPRSVSVYRKELLLAIRRENKRAALQNAELPTDLPSIRPVPREEAPSPES